MQQKIAQFAENDAKKLQKVTFKPLKSLKIYLIVLLVVLECSKWNLFLRGNGSAAYA